MKPTYPESLEWLPDWTDPTQYPLIDGSFCGTQWAWEFLRRSPEYQAAYSELFMRCFPTPRPSLSGLPPGSVMLPPTEAEIDLYCSMMERFRLTDGLFPPSPQSGGSGLVFRAGWLRYYRLDEDHSIPKNRARDATLLVAFDLSLPIEPQLKQARKIFQREGKGVARYKLQNLPEYLRILDAKVDLSKPTYSRIAETIFPELAGAETMTTGHPLVERAKEAYKVACKLRDLDYWKLVPL